MKRIKTYHTFLNERNERNEEARGLLFRNTSIQWLMDFLKKGEAVPYKSKKRYISFSKESDSGGMDEYGDVRIDFNAYELYKQGAIEIEYNIDFFENHSEICMYVTGYIGEEDYYQQSGYKGKEDFEKNGQDDADTLTWESMLESYEGESEVVLKKLKFKEGLIKKVVVDLTQPIFARVKKNRQKILQNFEKEYEKDFKFIREKGIKIEFE